MGGSVGSEDGDVGFQIASMVDVVFVLMLFFMACACSQIIAQETKIKLPTGAASGASTATPITINIAADGLVSMNDKSYGLPSDANLTDLRDFLRNALSTFGNDDPVIIKPSLDAKHERIIQVLNAITGAAIEDPANPGTKMNFKNLSFS